MYRIVRPDGSTYLARYRGHGFAREAQRYDRLAAVMAEPELVRFRVLGAEAWLLDSRALWKRAAEAMGSDSRFFVDRRP